MQLLGLHIGKMKDFVKRKPFVERCLAKLTLEPSTEIAALKTLGISDDEDEDGAQPNQASGLDEKAMKTKRLAIYKTVMDKEADKAH